MPSVGECLPVRRTTTSSTRAPRRSRCPQVEAEKDLVVEDPSSGSSAPWCAARRTSSTSRTGFGKVRGYPLGPGFWVDGRPVVLVRPKQAAPSGPLRSASGSTYVVGARARVAREGRIYVEGKHDAELVEKVWGHDLRIEGVVVEPLHGVDDLPGDRAGVPPHAGRRLGVLVDHLVTGSKESRIAEQVTGEHALVVGHPFIDIWQAVKPSVVGIKAWPTVPKGEPWKDGVCTAAGLGGRHRLRLGAAHPGPREELDRPRARPDRPRRGAHRLRHHRLSTLVGAPHRTAARSRPPAELSRSVAPARDPPGPTRRDIACGCCNSCSSCHCLNHLTQ